MTRWSVVEAGLSARDGKPDWGVALPDGAVPVTVSTSEGHPLSVFALAPILDPDEVGRCSGDSGPPHQPTTRGELPDPDSDDDLGPCMVEHVTCFRCGLPLD